MKYSIHSICLVLLSPIFFTSCISTKKIDKNDNQPQTSKNLEKQKNNSQKGTIIQIPVYRTGAFGKTFRERRLFYPAAWSIFSIKIP